LFLIGGSRGFWRRESNEYGSGKVEADGKTSGFAGYCPVTPGDHSCTPLEVDRSLQTGTPPATFWQTDYRITCMKRRFLYGGLAIVLAVNVGIGAWVFHAEAAEKDSAYPSLELFSYVLEKVRKDYVDGQTVKYQD